MAFMNVSALISSRLGCMINLTMVCTDALGRSVTADTPATVQLASLTAGWVLPDGSPTVSPLASNAVLPNTTLASLLLSVTPVLMRPMPALATIATLVTCTAALFASAAAPPPNVALASVASAALASVPCVAMASSNASSLMFACAGLSVPATAPLAANLTFLAQCVYAATQEALTLPPLQLQTPFVSAAMSLGTSSTIVPAYVNVPLNALVISSPISALSAAGGTCFVTLTASSSSLIVLSSASAAAQYAVSSSGTLTPAPQIVVQGPPAAPFFVQLQCMLWGTTVTSPLLPLTTAAFVTKFSSGSQLLSALPSSASGLADTLAALPPRAVDVTSSATASLACSMLIMPASVACPPVGLVLFGVGYVLTAVPPRLVGSPSASVDALPPNTTDVSMSFVNVGVYAPSGCSLQLQVTCRDGVNRQNSSVMPVTVALPPLAAAWADATASMTHIPPAPLLMVSIQLNATASSAPLPTGAIAARWACTAMLATPDMLVPWSTSLSSMLLQALTSSAATVSADGLTAAFTSLDASRIPLSSNVTLHAECVWTPTSERVRLPPLALRVASLAMAWSPDTPSSMIAARAQPLQLTFIITSDMPLPPLLCSWIAPVSADVTLNASSSGFTPQLVVNASGGIATYTTVLAISGSPGASIQVRLQCTAWAAQLMTPSSMSLTIAPLTVTVVQSPPDIFLPSGTGVASLLRPAIVARLTEAGNASPLPTTCTLASADALADVSLTLGGGVSATLFAAGVPSSPASGGDVTLPVFGIRTPLSPTGSAVNITLLLTCARTDTGDAAPPVRLTYRALQLGTRLCSDFPPQTATTSQTPLSPFRVAVMAGLSIDAAVDSTSSVECAEHASFLDTAAVSAGLHDITCSVADARDAAAIAASNASLILQGSSTALSVPAMIATFPAVTPIGSPGITYPLLLRCTVGGVSIPPDLYVNITLVGCAAGSQAQGVVCSPCGSGAFSMGSAAASIAPVLATCQKCPGQGAVCSGGMIALLPNYFRPQRQVAAHFPLGPDAELFPCLNAESCIVYTPDANMTHACAKGYTGPLCGVCDSDANYGRFGSVCRPCWATPVSQGFVAIVFIIIIVLLVYVALRRSDGGRSPSAIALKILLSYLQAVGSLRAFKAGGTTAYHSIMGWTDTISVSPVGSGALQCLMHMPFIAQYVITVTLPLIAAAIVMAIVVIAALARNVRINQLNCAWCRSRAQLASALRASTRRLRRATASVDMDGLRKAVGAWLHERKHVSTLLFVLFLSYMAIISSCLRALDCTQRIDGTRYVRSDLSVVCYTGQHAVAMFMSYIVLVAVGVGFPVLLFVLMARATAVQLSSPTFQSTWGFLYHGYRVNSAMARRVADIAAKLAEARRAHAGEGELSAPAMMLVQNPLMNAAGQGAASGDGALGSSGITLVHNPLVNAAETPSKDVPAALPSAHAAMVADAVMIMRSRSRMKRNAIMPKVALLAAAAAEDTAEASTRFAVAVRAFIAFRDLVHDLFVERLIWWEALVLLRKAGIVLIAVFIAEPVTQCAVATLLLGTGLVMQLTFQPYESTLFNRLEALSLATAAATAVISAVLTQFDVTSATFISEPPAAMTAAQWTVTIVLAMLNLSTMLVLGGAWLYLLAQAACTYTKRHAEHFTRLLKSPAASRLLRPRSRAMPAWSPDTNVGDVSPQADRTIVSTVDASTPAGAAAASTSSRSLNSPQLQRSSAVSTRKITRGVSSIKISASPRASRPSGFMNPQRRRSGGVTATAGSAEPPNGAGWVDTAVTASGDAASEIAVDERVRHEVAMMRSMALHFGNPLRKLPAQTE